MFALAALRITAHHYISVTTCHDDTCSASAVRLQPNSFTVPDARKRTAAQAGFPVESQTVRVTVCVPADTCTRNEPMVFSLVCHNSDNVDAVKKILTYRIREVTGHCPHLPSFQLHQNGRHIPFTGPITTLTTLDAVHFVRTAPDFRDANEWNQNAMTM